MRTILIISLAFLGGCATTKTPEPPNPAAEAAKAELYDAAVQLAIQEVLGSK